MLFPFFIFSPDPSLFQVALTFQIDIHDDVSGNDTSDINETGSVDDNGDALAGCDEALLIQNVFFQHGQLDLVLELCVNTRQDVETFSESFRKLPGKRDISLDR